MEKIKYSSEQEKQDIIQQKELEGEILIKTGHYFDGNYLFFDTEYPNIGEDNSEQRIADLENAIADILGGVTNA